VDNKLLQSLGLSDGEAAVYQAVIAAGVIEPAVLAKAAGVKRTTAYSLARGLAEKGLLVEDATRRPRIFTASSPEQVSSLIAADRNRLAERERSLKTLANELSKISSEKSYPVPMVRFIEETKIRDFLYQQDSIWDKSILDIGETAWWGFQDHTLLDHYGQWIKDFWKDEPENIEVNLISNRAPTELEFAQQNIARRHIKFWGEAANFLSTIWICGDYIIMINTRNRPFYLVEIHDKLMAHDQREVFKNLWPLV
jgi:hypothetical protein